MRVLDPLVDVVLVAVGVPVGVTVPVQVLRVMVVVVLVQDHIEVADVQTGLRHTGDLRPEPLQVKGRQRPVQGLPVGAEVEHRRHGHVSADAGVAFEVEHPSVHVIAFRNAEPV